jgi:hypothetical protein
MLNQMQESTRQLYELCKEKDAEIARLKSALRSVGVDLDYMWVNWGDVPSPLRQRCKDAAMDVRNALKEA